MFLFKCVILPMKFSLILSSAAMVMPVILPFANHNFFTACAETAGSTLSALKYSWIIVTHSKWSYSSYYLQIRCLIKLWWLTSITTLSDWERDSHWRQMQSNLCMSSALARSPSCKLASYTQGTWLPNSSRMIWVVWRALTIVDDTMWLKGDSFGSRSACTALYLLYTIRSEVPRQSRYLRIVFIMTVTY